ncbi:carbon-phosphorus lyase subunit PhnH [Scytonema hofmannii PCC 7110]|uniref:Carbon-phosphorus lyase subunit PhnH n=2 Tax=Scytonema hofmannii TaxID=34078 RepID=A0A139WXN5_9CYAN|nr:carbon-phosphorus lyase subunit PhnH [Scytonema hofmannii PCC 7110]
MINIDIVWSPETQQKIFRNLLNCMSLPGEIADISQHLGKSSALVGLLATLLDRSVTWSDEEELVKKSDRNLLQAPTTSSETAKFVIRDAKNPPEKHFCPNLGELANPEKGATLILQGTALSEGNTTLQLSGAGIPTTRLLHLNGFHPQWFRQRQNWVENFPLGIDVFLVDSTQVTAIPRTTHIQIPNAP